MKRFFNCAVATLLIALLVPVGVLFIPSVTWANSLPEGIVQQGAMTAGVRIQPQGLLAAQLSGNGTEASPYLVSSIADLQQLAYDVDSGEAYSGKHFQLTADLDLSGASSWSRIGSSSTKAFKGIFDGNGHKLLNLNLQPDSATTTYQGLFGYVGSGAIIKDMKLSGTVSTSGGCTGSIAGVNFGTISGCTFSGTVSSTKSSVGGIAGQNFGTVSRCSVDSSSSVVGESSVGGIVGDNWKEVKDCACAGSVSGANSTERAGVGGIAGTHSLSSTESVVSGCTSSGAVRGRAGVGGVVGCNGKGTVIACANTGTVSSNENSPNASYIGGVVGYNGSSKSDNAGRNATVSQCLNEGTVTSAQGYVGGVVGYSYGAVLDCYNTGNVTAKTFVGGVAGVLKSYSSSKPYELGSCYNYGTVTATASIEYLGGLVGAVQDNGTRTPSYSLKNACTYNGAACSKGAVGYWGGSQAGNAFELSADEFALRASFDASSWDFSDVWAMDSALGRPVFRRHVHELVHHEAVAPTCIEGGKTEYWECEGCGKCFSDAAAMTEIEEAETAIEALGHDWEVPDSWHWALDDSDDRRFSFTLTCKNNAAHTHEFVCEIEIDPDDAGSTDLGFAVTVDDVLLDLDGPIVLGDADDAPDAELFWNDETPTANVVITGYTEDFDPVTEATVSCKITCSVTPSSCTVSGKRTYTADLTVDGAEYSCVSDPVALPVGEHDLSTVEAVEATCAHKGSIAHWKCATCGKLFGDSAASAEVTQEDIETEALGHDWGAPVYSWAADNSSVTASRTCSRSATHVETATSEATYSVTVQPTATEAGVGTYTAVFASPFETQVKTVPIPSTGHGIEISSMVDIEGEGTPAVAVDGLDSLAALIADQESGGGVSVDSVLAKMTITGRAEQEVQAAGDIRNLAEAASDAGSKVEIDFFDMTLEKTVGVSGNKTVEVISESPKVLALNVPFDFEKRIHAHVYREHGGIVESLTELSTRPVDSSSFIDGAFYSDEAGGVVRIYASKFSVYSIAYELVSENSAPTGGLGGEGGNNASRDDSRLASRAANSNAVYSGDGKDSAKGSPAVSTGADAAARMPVVGDSLIPPIVALIVGAGMAAAFIGVAARLRVDAAALPENQPFRS